MSTAPTATLTATVDLHLAAYGEPDPARRAELIAQAWSEDGVLLDPPLTGEGHDGLGAAADALLGQFPAHTFRRTTAVDEHHGVARYAWELVSPEGAVVLAGTDVVDVAADGRLQRVVGFFGDAPA